MKALCELDLEPNMPSIEDVIRSIEDAIHSTEDAIRSNNLSANRTPKYWWNESLTVAHRNQHAALKKQENTPITKIYLKLDKK